MIFASVGSMLPFDRLVEAVDDWAGAHRQERVFVQIGEGSFVPRHAAWTRMMSHPEYLAALGGCDLFVAHVGVGSMVQALEIGKQALLLPRLAERGEHTTDHQLHTAARFGDTAGIEIVHSAGELQQRMTALLHAPLAAGTLASVAPATMLKRVMDFLEQPRAA
ncbi:glycosyltransferase [Sphingomonas aracearum]|uniref:Glycosyl transferase family 28 C-terminal domain-containing protein n=1 Tax=Sphingomonas aracearum TaxID=2283317 RepID=A0A369W2K6_9SPHN|nr:glycosyltransferase [Sphingomonas aracearum]RDE06301.1 hypothetical protein DVW87_00790 [Sphingomonas aracearum]